MKKKKKAEAEAEDESDEEDDSDEDDDGGVIDPGKNIVAIHDSSSKQYDKDCIECHASVHTEESLDPTIPPAHLAMFDFAPGKPGDKKQCVWCHRSVDLTQATQTEGISKGNLRKRVDTALCGLCHGPSGPGPQFYQTGLSPTEPDGPALYDLVCAACHRDLNDSEVRDESAREIQEAIEDNEGGMRPLRALSSQEIRAIADALAR
jgi:hypothetical protein